MATIIKDFHELYPPTRYMADHDKDWTIYSRQEMLSYLMNDGSNNLVDLLGSLDVPTCLFYFDTELDCHLAAEAYYNSHGMLYPYRDRMLECLNPSAPTVGNSVKTVQSEVMEF